ncbi:MAG: energy transducer TonB [Myxococcales bacterium]
MSRSTEAAPPAPIETRLLPAPPPPPPPPKVAPPPPKLPPPRPAPHIVAHHAAPAAPEVKIGKQAPSRDQKTVAAAEVATANVTSELPNAPGPAFEPKAEAPPPAPVERPRPPPPPVSRPPEVVEHPTPELSQELRAQDFQGQALILFVVDGAGRAQPHLLQSTGNAQIDALALDAARHWTFRPALDKGKPVAAQLQVEMQISVE